MEQEKVQRPLQWHPAFYADLQIELEAVKENLICENEHQLGTKPMAIDVLIIKKQLTPCKVKPTISIAKIMTFKSKLNG